MELVAQAFGVPTSHVAQQAKEQRHESQFYTVQMIDDVLGEVSQSKELHLRLRASFARMMAFDALVGANDRHAENWGGIEDVRSSRILRFAPIYDTARGLLLRLSDEELVRWYAGDAEKELARYAQKSVSLIGTGEHERPNHFEVFRHMVHDPLFRSAVSQVVRAFSPSVVRRILCNDFSRLMSRVRLRAIDDLLRYRHAKLIEACRESRAATT